MSTHSVSVLRCPPIEKHPNADSLGLIHIDGFTAAVRLGEFQEGELIAYIEPDYVVPDTEQFSFLKDRRIRSKRLRGVWSMGLVIKAPEGSREGQNVMEQLGVTRYEPPPPKQWVGAKHGEQVGLAEVPPLLRGHPKYDLENWRKFGAATFEEGEPVVVTEKIHGSNARYCFHQGVLYCGSRSFWRKSEPDNMFHDGAKHNPWVREWCEKHPDLVLYGELFGMQDLKYGKSATNLGFLAFDVMDPLRLTFEDHWTLGLSLSAEHCVPVVYKGPYKASLIAELAEENSFAGGVSEGVVIRPEVERFSTAADSRAVLKCVSNRYLERAK